VSPEFGSDEDGEKGLLRLGVSIPKAPFPADDLLHRDLRYWFSSISSKGEVNQLRG